MKGAVLNTGEEAPYTEKITEIIWKNGSIPSGQRDEFAFSTQVPATKTQLIWKAYQTYADGTVISWDQEAAHENGDDDDTTNTGPYSVTEIVNDLENAQGVPAASTKPSLPVSLSIVALALSVVSLVVNFSTRKK